MIIYYEHRKSTIDKNKITVKIHRTVYKIQIKSYISTECRHLSINLAVMFSNFNKLLLY